jgi:TatA/E family protein of Tat protein translocase
MNGMALGFGVSPGFGEILTVLVVVLVLFGAKRVPEIARSLGRLIAELQRASQEFRDQILRAELPESAERETGSSPDAVDPEPAGSAVSDPEPEPDSAEGADDELAG